MARVRFSVGLQKKESDMLNAIKEKYYHGNASVAVADAVRLLDKMYGQKKIVDSRRLAGLLAVDERPTGRKKQ